MYQLNKQRPRSLQEAMTQAMGDSYSPDQITREDSETMPMGMDAISGAMRPPTEPSGYVMAAPKGVAWDPSLEKSAREWFFNAGLPQSVVTGILQQYCRRACGGKSAQMPSDAGSDLTRLRNEWGLDWDRNVGLARAVVKSCNGGQQLLDILDESGLGSDAWLIQTLAAVGQSRQQ